MRRITFREAIRESLEYNMKNDDRVFVAGEDIGRYGGPFGVTGDLFEKFGPKRVVDTPISEAAIAGCGIGAALGGLRPVVEIEFIDFSTCCMDMIVNQMAKIHYASGGQSNVPMVLRTNSAPMGSTSVTHSQSFYAFFVHIPGLIVVVPSTPYDAKGLLNTSIISENPVIFIESKRLYNTKGEVPEEYYTIPFGKADIKKEGNDITLVATQHIVLDALKVAEEMDRKGISIEVIDPRTLNPLDRETIFESVKKTGKLIIADSGCLTCGITGEISAIVTDNIFEYLDVPPIRIGSPDTPPPSSPPLEEEYVPGAKEIRKAVEKIS
jgi:pyruvate dehydrogenase E1 component beta subunit